MGGQEIVGNPSIMILGLGDLGGQVLEFLARVPQAPRIMTADLDEDRGLRRINSAIQGASQFGLYPDIEFTKLDVFDVDKTANLLKEIQPFVVFNAVTLQSWWVAAELPRDAYKAIDQTLFAPWFPVHFVPTFKVMQAVKRSATDARVVNAAFPDLVNPVLHRVGYAPTTGIGNVDSRVSGLRLAAARMFNAPMRAVTIYMVAHHFVSYHLLRYGNAGGAPYYLKLIVDEVDMTPQINTDQFLAEAISLTKIPTGKQAHQVVASTACKTILGILFDRKELSHAPGPKGLPGGYPVTLSAGGVEVFLPDGLDLEEAVKINTEAQVFDGIKSIEKDGTVVLTNEVVEVMKKLLDFDCEFYTVEDSESKGRELQEKFNRWASRFK